MVWALLFVYLTGASGVSSVIAILDSAKLSINSDIGDKARRTELLALVSDAEKTTKQYVKTGEKTTKELIDLGERHDARSAEYQAVAERMRADAEAYQDRTVSHLFALKGKMTREEWTRAFPAEKAKPEQK